MFTLYFANFYNIILKAKQNHLYESASYWIWRLSKIKVRTTTFHYKVRVIFLHCAHIWVSFKNIPNLNKYKRWSLPPSLFRSLHFVSLNSFMYLVSNIGSLEACIPFIILSFQMLILLTVVHFVLVMIPLTGKWDKGILRKITFILNK